jgi:hypothetical protein
MEADLEDDTTVDYDKKSSSRCSASVNKNKFAVSEKVKSSESR